MSEQDIIQAQQVVNAESVAVDEFINGMAIVKITSQPEYDQMNIACRAVRERKKELETKQKSILDPMRDAIDRVRELFKEPIAKLELFEQGLKKCMVSFINEQERIRLEDQRKANEEAAKARAALEKKAEKQESKGNEQAATMTRQIAETFVAPVVQKKVEAKGVFAVDKWKARVTDKAAFIAECVAKNALEYLEINEGMLNKEAQATKGQRTWAGVTVEKFTETRMR